MRRLHEPIYRARLRELVRQIVPLLRPGDRVLDVGCGAGTLGRALLDAPDCPPDVSVQGLETAPRGDEPIEVLAYDGQRFPLDDGSVDLVIVADVLHHEPEPDRLLRECCRVSRRHLVIKDHKPEGPLGWWRVALIDWAANAPYGVPCLFRYRTARQWRAAFADLRLKLVQERQAMRLYPPVVNLFFGGRLQYFAVLEVSGESIGPAQNRQGDRIDPAAEI
ncbi:class I SAM-dependent methyltransferase [Phycisphaerales bacterium AB-hyl4]|uniref:Class I SAM-dependent methyltransferase n=1 Tax=Natronomicrosphaera hydrolytica TaxID=3242702 RepID=A0ABV4U6X3_9BACT